MPRNRYVITFPRNCDDTILTYKRVINDHLKLMDTFSDKEIVFDCGNINFIRPLGLNILAPLIRSLLQQESSTIFFACPTNLGCEQYFNDQGFYKEFRLGDRDKAIKASPRSTSIGLRRMEVFEPFYLQQIAQWLNRNLSLPEEIITDAVTIPLSEIILNVVDHSQSSMGCYICAQSYPQEKKLMLSVAVVVSVFSRLYAPDIRV